MRRLTSSSLAGTFRKLVAVGMPRLAVMFWTIRAAAPRKGSPGGSSAKGAGAAIGDGAEGAVAGGGGAPGDVRVDVALVVREEVAPALTDRRGIVEVLLVHLVDEPGVGPQRGCRVRGLRRVTHGHRWYR